MKELDYGKEYKYSHDYENNFVKQDFLPKEIKNSRFWEAQNSPAESKLSDWMKKLWG
jgi:putative ATPase